MSARFNARNSSWSNVRFNFVGKIPRAYVLYLVYPLLLFTTIAFIIYNMMVSVLQSLPINVSDMHSKPELTTQYWILPLAPYVFAYIVAIVFLVIIFRLTQMYAVNGHRLVNLPFRFDVRLWKYFRVVFVAMLAGLSAGILAGLAVFAILIVFAGGSAAYSVGTTTFWLAALAFGYVAFWVGVRNLLLRNLELGVGEKKHRFNSTVDVLGLFILIATNAVAIMLSFGLLLPWAKVRYTSFRSKSEPRPDRRP